MTEIGETLIERRGRYGPYDETTRLAQQIKDVMRTSGNWNSGLLTFSMRESLDMIAAKLARILNGDPDYQDSWHDICGYAKLIEKQLQGEAV